MPIKTNKKKTVLLLICFCFFTDDIRSAQSDALHFVSCYYNHIWPACRIGLMHSTFNGGHWDKSVECSFKCLMSKQDVTVTRIMSWDDKRKKLWEERDASSGWHPQLHSGNVLRLTLSWLIFLLFIPLTGSERHEVLRLIRLTFWIVRRIGHIIVGNNIISVPALRSFKLIYSQKRKEKTWLLINTGIRATIRAKLKCSQKK